VDQPELTSDSMPTGISRGHHYIDHIIR